MKRRVYILANILMAAFLVVLALPGGAAAEYTLQGEPRRTFVQFVGELEAKPGESQTKVIPFDESSPVRQLSQGMDPNAVPVEATITISNLDERCVGKVQFNNEARMMLWRWTVLQEYEPTGSVVLVGQYNTMPEVSPLLWTYVYQNGQIEGSGTPLAQIRNTGYFRFFNEAYLAGEVRFHITGSGVCTTTAQIVGW